MPKNKPNKQKVIQKSKNTRKWHQTLLMVLPTLRMDRSNSLMEPMFQELTRESSLRSPNKLQAVTHQLKSLKKKLRNISPRKLRQPRTKRKQQFRKQRTIDGIKLIDSPDLSTIKTAQKHLLQRALKSEV